MLKVNLNQSLKDQNGNDFGKEVKTVVMDNEGNVRVDKNKRPLIGTVIVPELKKTLRDVFVNCLLEDPIDEDPRISGRLTKEEKASRYALFFRLSEAKKEIMLNADEVVLLKKVINDHEGILVTGRCFDILDYNSDKK